MKNRHFCFWFPFGLHMDVFGRLGRVLGRLGGVLGVKTYEKLTFLLLASIWYPLGPHVVPTWTSWPSWPRLGASCGHLGYVLEASWARLGAPWAVLEASWLPLGAVLGASWGYLDAPWSVWVRLGGVFGVSLDVLGRLRCVFGASGGVLRVSWMRFGDVLRRRVSWRRLGFVFGCLGAFWGCFGNLRDVLWSLWMS